MTDSPLLRYEQTTDSESATASVDLDREEPPVLSNLFGGFCEHLGQNNYHDMVAQILTNPTFGTGTSVLRTRNTTTTAAIPPSSRTK